MLRRACAFAQSRQSLRCSPTWSMEVDEESDQKSDILPHWMAAHARLKNEFTEDEKCHNLMSWFKLSSNTLLICFSVTICWGSVVFLAHLSWRLTRWAYSIAMVRRPSVVGVRRRQSSSVVVHTFKPVYLWSQLANLDQILCVASLGWGKGCIRFWGRLDQNSGFHGNRKPPLTYNGKNHVSTFSRLFLIGSFVYLQVTRTCIKSRTSTNFHQIGPLTTELAALEHLKNFP